MFYRRLPLWAVAFIPLGWVSIQPVRAEPLSFADALALAEARAPALAARTAALEAARANALPAGALPDPKLALGLDNFPVSGPPAWSPARESMAMGRIGLQQDVPNADKRQARVDIAAAAVAREKTMATVELVRVRRETAMAWIDRYYVEQRGALLDGLAAENRGLAEAITAQLAAGRANPADSIMPRQEAAEIVDRRDDLERDLDQAKASLRRWIGPAADERLAGAPPTLEIDASFRQHLHRHPNLQLFAPAAQLAEAEVREAAAAKIPDWGVGVAYQRRSPEFGDMVSLQLMIDLPVFSATRQDPKILAKRQEAARIAAEEQSALKEHAEALERDLAEHAALVRQADRLRGTRRVLAEEKVALQMNAYRAGGGDLASVITARRELIDLRIAALDLERRRARTAARLIYTYREVQP